MLGFTAFPTLLRDDCFRGWWKCRSVLERSALPELTVPPQVGMLDFPAFTHVACSKHFPLLEFRVEMAFQRFPALVVVFI